MNKKSLTKIILTLTAATIAGLTAVSCSSPYAPPNKTDLKDMSSEGYEIAMYQRANGTEHNRQIDLFVDQMGSFPNPSFNLLDGTYQNTGTEAPEHLRDPSGNIIFTQTEYRRYFDFWDNAREDATNIMLFESETQKLYNAAMARFQTEWWGNADVRAISVNNGPLMFRLSGITNHLGIETQQVFSVIVPEESKDFTWMFNQNNAGDVKNYFTKLAEKLEKTEFKPKDEHVLMSTWDSDSGLDLFNLEVIPAQGELYDGTVKYVIAAGYFGPNNQPTLVFGPGDFWGHQGAPDRGNDLGTSLDTILLAMGDIDNPKAWEPKAKVIVYHPTWSNQTEYKFIKVNADGTEKEMGVLQRTYNNKSQTDSDGKTVLYSGTNNYLAKGDINYIQDCLTLIGGQQVTLGLDYKTSYMDYAVDLFLIAQGTVSEKGMDPELVASLNINADSTIVNVVDAAKNVFGVEPTEYFAKMAENQKKANVEFQEYVKNNSTLTKIYDIKE